MTHQNPTPNIYVLDASDCLNRAKEILEFVLEWHSKDREQSAGLGWTLGEVQSGISDAMALLNSAVAASAEPPSH